MKIHSPPTHAALRAMNLTAEWNRLEKSLLKIDGPEVLGEGDEWGHDQSTFYHVMGGYDAGYFTYL